MWQDHQIEAIAVEGAVGQSPNGMTKFAGSDIKMEGYHPNI